MFEATPSADLLTQHPKGLMTVPRVCFFTLFVGLKQPGINTSIMSQEIEKFKPIARKKLEAMPRDQQKKYLENGYLYYFAGARFRQGPAWLVELCRQNDPYRHGAK